MKKSILCASMLIPALAWAGPAEEVIAITRAQWAAEMAGADIDIVMKDVADDYTEFNPATPVRIDGRALASRLSAADLQARGDLLAAEMANPKVQIYGDTAILTYNYLGKFKTPEGTVDNAFAKSTRVYVKLDGGWQLVHANFAAMTPPEN
jgi:ketosteroid isomerase-like protein